MKCENSNKKRDFYFKRKRKQKQLINSKTKYICVVKMWVAMPFVIWSH